MSLVSGHTAMEERPLRGASIMRIGKPARFNPATQNKGTDGLGTWIALKQVDMFSISCGKTNSRVNTGFVQAKYLKIGSSRWEGKEDSSKASS